MPQSPGFWETFRTYFWVRYFNLHDMLSYWQRAKEAACDLSLLSLYFFKSPYRIARQFHADEPYGETPFGVLKKLVDAAPVTAQDVVYELGSGRGRACFWFGINYGCQTVGVEYIPIFVERAKSIASLFRLKNIQFRLEDICESDLSDATWIYFFGTGMPDEAILKLVNSFERLKPGTKIMSISYPLTDYTTNPHIVLTGQLELEFAWGKTDGYLHVIEK